MRISEIMTLLLLISLVVIGTSGFIGSFALTYGASTPDLAYINQTINVTRRMESMQTTLSKQDEPSQSPTDSLWNYVSGISATVIDTIMLFFAVPNMFGVIMNSLELSAPVTFVPSWVWNITFTIIIITVAFAIYRVIAKTSEA